MKVREVEKAIVTDIVLHYPKLGTMWYLPPKIVEAVKAVEQGEQEVTVDDGASIFKISKDEKGVIIREYAIVTRSRWLTHEYIENEFDEILEFLRRNQPVRKKDLKRKFLDIDSFLKAAKALGIIKATNRGFVIAEEADSK